MFIKNFDPLELKRYSDFSYQYLAHYHSMKISERGGKDPLVSHLNDLLGRVAVCEYIGKDIDELLAWVKVHPLHKVSFQFKGKGYKVKTTSTSGNPRPHYISQIFTMKHVEFKPYIAGYFFVRLTYSNERAWVVGYSEYNKFGQTAIEREAGYVSTTDNDYKLDYSHNSMDIEIRQLDSFPGLTPQPEPFIPRQLDLLHLPPK
jgi:hypothetical protein